MKPRILARATAFGMALLMLATTAVWADQVQVDGDTAKNGNALGYTDAATPGTEACSTRGTAAAGVVKISWNSNIHFDNNSTVTVAVTPNATAAAAGITASGGSASVPNGWGAASNTSGFADFSVNISTTVPNYVVNGTYTINVQATGQAHQYTGSGGSIVTVVDPYVVTSSYSVTINCTFTAPPPVTDAVDPDTTINSNPSDPSNSSSASFTFSGTDNLTTPANLDFECKLDAGSFAACTSPQNYSSLTDGSHTFQVRAIDEAGNVDESPASFTWVVDTTAPNTTITSNPSNPSNSSSASFSFSGNDGSGTGVASFECQLDGGGYAACTSPQSYSSLADGSHTFDVRAIDGAGNVDPTPASYTWTVDATPPDTTIDTSPTNPTNSTSASFTFSGSDGTGTGVASFECQLDGGGYAACTSPQNYSSLSDGSHTFQVRAIDGAGNVDPTPASFTWLVDTVAPTIADDGFVSGTAGANGWYVSAVENGFSASDPGGSGIDAACDLAFPKNVSSGTDEGSLVTVNSGPCSDLAGNTNPGIDSTAYKIDLSDPTVTLTTPPNGATYTLGQVVNADFSCADTISDIDTCVGTVADGSAIDTATIGTKSFVVTATDNAGRTKVVTHTYSVVYDWDGFFSPVDNPQVFNKAKAGQSIPVKFSLNGDQGLNIFWAGFPTSKEVPCDATSSTDLIEVYATTATNNKLIYDATADQYNYVWSTNKSWAGTCRQLSVKLTDGTIHQALFNFTK